MAKQILSRLFTPVILIIIISFSYYCSSSVQAGNKISDKLIQSQINLQDFRSSLSGIVNESQMLTKSYQDEIGKWTSNQYDNSSMISITDSFIPKFENITNAAQNMTYSKDYKYIHDALVNSLKSETDSYKHFRNYLVSGNKSEDEISTDLLTKALQYEMIYSKFLSTPLQDSDQTIATRLDITDSLFFTF